jgi:4-hydroxybenzoate polyprenyltransferase
MFRRLSHILEMIRFSHTLFALPFAMLGAVMAWTSPLPEAALAANVKPVRFRLLDLVGILLCMVLARSAAMAFNRIADHRIDADNPRTKNRHIPAGILSLSSVAAFTICSSVGFIASTLLFLPNRLPIILSVPVLGFLLLYSYTKRFTSLAHFWLGAALMLTPVCAWLAIRGEVVLLAPRDLGPPLVLGLAVLLWVSGFDIIYSCQDYEYDKQKKLRSIPAILGIVGALRLAAICHLGMVAALLILPASFSNDPLGWIYFTGVIAVAGLLAYEHWIVRPDDLSRVNRAFFQVNMVVSIGLFIVGSLDMLV